MACEISLLIKLQQLSSYSVKANILTVAYKTLQNLHSSLNPNTPVILLFSSRTSLPCALSTEERPPPLGVLNLPGMLSTRSTCTFSCLCLEHSSPRNSHASISHFGYLLKCCLIWDSERSNVIFFQEAMVSALGTGMAVKELSLWKKKAIQRQDFHLIFIMQILKNR